MCVEKMTLRDAYKEVQSIRNIICPNVGFFKQMIELEEKVGLENSVATRNTCFNFYATKFCKNCTRDHIGPFNCLLETIRIISWEIILGISFKS